MDGLDTGRDPGRREAAAVRRIEQLHVLDTRHEGHPGRGRLEHVERDPDRRIADRVDLGRDPAGRGPLDEVAQLVRLA